MIFFDVTRSLSPMTDINGLHLAYRGLVAGLAGGYVWLATALLMALPGGNALEPLQMLAGGGGSRAETFVTGLLVVQVAAGGIGIGFAYFLARYFTVRPTLAVAAPCFAVLAWLAVSSRLGVGGLDPRLQVGLLGAAILYGVMLGAWVPTRIEVLRPFAALSH